MSENTRSGCFIAGVFCIILIAILVAATFCRKITRESDARLCAEYEYQCGGGDEHN